MYNYYAIEIQTNADGTGSLLPYGYESKGDCEGKFLALREFARQSNVLIHTVLFIDNKGKHQEDPAIYTHPVPEEGTAE